MKSKTINTGIFLLVEKLTKIISSLIIISLVAKSYELKEFGNYAYHMAIFTIFSMVINFGSEQMIVYESSKYKKFQLSDYFFLRLFSAIICSIILKILVLLDFVNASYYTIFCISFLSQTIYVMIPYYQGLMNYRNTSIAVSLAIVLSLIMKCYLVVVDDALNISLLITLDTLFISTGLSLIYFFDKNIIIRFYFFNSRKIKKIAINCFPLFVSAIGIIIYARSDQVIIKHLMDDASTGLYSSVIKLSEVFTFILPIGVNLSLSIVAKYLNKDKDKSKHYLMLFKISNIYALSCIIFLYFFNESIILLLYTEEFLQAVNILSVYSVSLLFMSMGSMSNVWLIDKGLQKYKVYRVIFGVVLNIALNLVLIPNYGLIGAAIATVISQFFSSFVANSFTKETRSLFFLQLNSLKVYKW
ncbi:hypothetical protein CWO08_08395 [Vibrio sp. 10N.286.48.B8]|uniref:flippase n=1 Tax=Vibrio sp. 10N.286.48.B8 TaxID=2056189 RepID=UPI000D340E2F|nr:flippase [Vibrio sp. 10N.286.48.B8]PTO96261.1 hypothetical protein CWO08_08395 [Vibrio sp. 10N.286.48.B8]